MCVQKNLLQHVGGFQIPDGNIVFSKSAYKIQLHGITVTAKGVKILRIPPAHQIEGLPESDFCKVQIVLQG